MQCREQETCGRLPREVGPLFFPEREQETGGRLPREVGPVGTPPWQRELRTMKRKLALRFWPWHECANVPVLATPPRTRAADLYIHIYLYTR